MMQVCMVSRIGFEITYLGRIRGIRKTNSDPLLVRLGDGQNKL